MSDPGPAQLDLIRRYARTMRALQADAMAARGPRIGASAARDRAASDPLPADQRPLVGRPSARRRDAGAPTLPAS
jgi:hypothetical protein